MFNVKAEPVANVPPYKRVSINDLRSADPNIVPTKRTDEEMLEHFRIWALVKGAAEGTNVTAREYEAPAEDVA